MSSEDAESAANFEIDLTGCRLPATRRPFVANLNANLQQRCAVKPSDRLIAAVSGGADSMALMLALAALRRRPHLRYDVHVVTVDHGLRDASADECRLVARVADHLGLPCQVARVSTDLRAAEGNLADNARGARYACLQQAAEGTGASAIVTAHHGLDQLETVLSALVRGAGPAGLAGMPWRSLFPRRPGTDDETENDGDACHRGPWSRHPMPSAPVVRPMLDVDPAECKAFCREHGCPWVSDPTNTAPDTLRGHLRANVLPGLLHLAPNLPNRIWRTGDALRSADAVVTMNARSLLNTAIISAVSDDDVTQTPDRGLNRHGPRDAPREVIADHGDTQFMRIDRHIMAAAPPIVSGAALRVLATSRFGIAVDRIDYPLVETTVAAIRDGERHPRTFAWPEGLRIAIARDEVRLHTDDDQSHHGPSRDVSTKQ